MYLVRSGAIAGFEKLAHSLGANPIQLIRDTGLSESQFRNPNSYISYIKMAELLERCASKCNRPLFGLLLSELDNSAVLGDLPITVAQESTVGKALIELDRYIYLFANGVHIQQVPLNRKTVRLVMSFDFQTPLGLNQLIQHSVASLASITAQLMGTERRALQIHLKQASPETSSGTDQHSQHGFFPNVTFSSSFDGVQLPARALRQKTRLDEVAVQQHFKGQLSHLQERYPDSLQDQVRALIGQLLPAGECYIEKVAANLDLHPRMLQLKLQQENTSYQQLLRETRQTIAEQHLQQSLISITDLALNLGYADIAVFSRNFKSWTGKTPRQWRKEAISQG
jgi:AraC-like DNA-binding protein